MIKIVLDLIFLWIIGLMHIYIYILIVDYIIRYYSIIYIIDYIYTCISMLLLKYI